MTNTQYDAATLAAYDAGAASFAQDWESQPAGSDLHDAIMRFFKPGGPTADIGCGSGRDTAWLCAHGFAATGFDGAQGLLQEARKRHPGVSFLNAMLPDLMDIADSSFANILCETVIMHLPAPAIPIAVRRMANILMPGGTLYLSWRVTDNAHRRDEHRRLYTVFDPNLVLHALTGMELLLDEQVESLSSGKLIRRAVARKPKRETAMSHFDEQPVLADDTVHLRPARADDWAALYAVARDPAIWAVHPIPWRWQETSFRGFFDRCLASGRALVIEDAVSGAVIGLSRYDRERAEDDEIEIGWTFLARDRWGGATNAAVKRLMIAHALTRFERVIFLIGESNLRSRRALEKIGGTLTPRHVDTPVEGQIIRHLVYAIDRTAFAKTLSIGSYLL
jgi:RimJ/RimL family protein N-acetyltransferase